MGFESTKERRVSLRAKLTRIVNIIFLLLGLGLLLGLLVRLDFEQVGSKIVQVGWFFAPIFLVYIAGLVLTTLAWKEIIDPTASRAQFRDLFTAFWTGHAINVLTPTGSAGEVLKGSIVKDKIDGEEVIASLITLNFMSTLVIQLFTLIGPILCIIFVDLPMKVVLAVFGIAALFFIPVALLYLLLRLGVAHRAIWLLSKLPLIKLKDPDMLLHKAKSIDRRITNFRKNRPNHFAMAILLLFGVRLTQALELWIILLVLLPDHNTLWLLLLSILTQTASQLIAWALTFIPGQVGVAEGGSALLFKLLGLDPLMGFSMELVRRIRKIIGVIIGLLIGFYVGLRPASKKK